ncbi:rhomboid family intramembrane serine protease [Kangiella aquimarina]|uniref:Rhomboid family intramembrane serine protease n=2 Tax=Kangiella aquimarina TaxID=261965 RepID=A0ABZ0X4L9_9GAMM|nr:rhomboid family intramembrane serine protease [Kangiella aquimarina]WQG85550.1 rhomboid family intramembrane serine protease [Kangiella aquimarina]
MLKDFLSQAGWMTKTLVGISILVSILTMSGTNEYTYWFAFNWNLILQGEVHRLITPIFLHFMIGAFPIHLLFNMMWLWDQGGSIEKARSAWYLLVIVLITGVASNVGEYFSSVYFGYGRSYLFGGMSGVVYGLLGFNFVRRRFDPFFPVHVHPGLMQFMLLWLVLGFTGLLGNIANAAHLIGLLSGGLLGYITAKTRAF